MKRKSTNPLLPVIIGLVMLFTGLSLLPQPVFASEYFEGNGTSSSPFLVSSETQLATLAALVNSAIAPYNSASYLVTQDIVLTDPNWTPIGLDYSVPFSGTFDGNNHMISGLSMQHWTIEGETGYFGFFGCSYGTIKRLILDGCDIQVSASAGSNIAVGGIAGINVLGVIQDCQVSGNIASDHRIGGVVGFNDGLIDRCSFSGTLFGNEYVGGVVGLNDGGAAINNCYNTGMITGNSFIGGIVGQNSATISYCYNIGTIAGSDSSCVGIAAVNIGTIDHCYYSDQAYKGVYIGDDSTVACSIWQMQQQSTYSGFDFSSTWIISSEQTTPLLRSRITVTYDSQGGSNIASSEIAYGNFLPVPESPVKSGYVFSGWYQDPACTVSWDFFQDSIVSELILYAKWVEISSSSVGTIDFTWGSHASFNNGGVYDADGHLIFSLISPTNSISFSDLNSLLSPTNPVVLDYLTIRFEPNVRVIWPSTVTLTNYGTIQIANTSISYATVYNHGVLQCGNLILNGSFYLAGPIQSFGYISQGGSIYFAPGGSISFISKPSWVDNGASVAAVLFESQGGSSVPLEYVYYGTYVVRPPDPQKTGYTFCGWYKDALGSSIWDFSSDFINYSTTLYAKWTPRSYTIRFDRNNGDTEPDPALISADFGSTIALPQPPTRAHYTFVGWNTAADGTGLWFDETSVISGDLTVYAQWTLQLHAVQFDSHGGSWVETVMIGYGLTVSEPEVPVREGYSFAGWFLDEAYEQPWVFDSDKVTSDILLHAKWSINHYAVHYDTQGGSTIEGVIVLYNTMLQPPNDPTKTGSTFSGWYLDPACTVRWDFEQNTVKSEMTLYAKWDLNLYRVQFDSTGGSLVEPVVAAYRTTISTPIDPIKTGYSLAGWYQDAELTVIWNFETDIVTADIRLYAKWTINQYMVSFCSNDGSAVNALQADYNTTITQPADPTKTGYMFAGWYKDSGLTTAWDFHTDVITSDITLYAKWTVNQYTVSFDSNSGSPIDSIITNYNTMITQPADPNRMGYTFAGWYKDIMLTNPWNFSHDMVMSDVTLYAKWIINQYGVSFTTNGGTWVNEIMVDYNSLIVKPDDPHKMGSSFSGWYKDVALTLPWDFLTDRVTQDMTLYAKWELDQYTVTFDSYGGSYVIPIQAMYGDKIARPEDPVRNGYTFVCWDQYVLPETTWDFDSDIIVGNLTLYARWTINQYTLTYDGNGNTSGTAPKPETHLYGYPVNVPGIGETDLRRTGFYFGGWNTQPDGRGVIYNNSGTGHLLQMPAHDLTIYAYWTCTVTFLNLYDSSIDPIVVHEDDLISAPQEPTREGYIFCGWYKDWNFVQQWDFSQDRIFGDTYLVAKWEQVVDAVISYRSHVQDIGWLEWVSNGDISGTSGEAKRLEAIEIKLANVAGGVEYRTHVQDIGWMDYVSDGVLSGTSGQAKRLEAINIQLTGEASNLYDIYYRVHAEAFGWLDWARNGAPAGTAGFGYRLEAIEIVIVAKDSMVPGATTLSFVDKTSQPATISYHSHVQDIGWQDWVSNGALSGTSGEAKRLEAIEIMLMNVPGGVEYRTHVQDIGWMSYVSDGGLSGTSGETKRLEAINIRLTGEASNLYDIYYRVHAETLGWLDWAKNDAPAGTAGFSYRLEAIEIVIVAKGSAAPGATTQSFIDKNTLPATVSYRSHVQDVGWQDWVSNGALSGTSGESKRLEAIEIKLANVFGGIEYRTHVQDIGWMDYVSDGVLSGTSGQAKRLEAISIRLTGDAANYYDIYYRVHAEAFGWLDWAKNDAPAGTAGFSYRLEAIEIVIVANGSAAPGEMDSSFVQK